MGVFLLQVIVFSVIIWFFVWQFIDRRKNPEKWRIWDEKCKAREAAAREREYQRAMERVPASVWMRMTKNQKADVLERRERAEKSRAR